MFPRLGSALSSLNPHSRLVLNSLQAVFLTALQPWWIMEIRPTVLVQDPRMIALWARKPFLVVRRHSCSRLQDLRQTAPVVKQEVVQVACRRRSFQGKLPGNRLGNSLMQPETASVVQMTTLFSTFSLCLPFTIGLFHDGMSARCAALSWNGS